MTVSGWCDRSPNDLLIEIQVIEQVKYLRVADLDNDQGDMPEKDTKFRFLTMEEFNQLPRRDKVTYLERATEEIKRQPKKTAKQSLFKDGPPLPQSPRKNPRGSSD